jgi:hypothetical protein
MLGRTTEPSSLGVHSLESYEPLIGRERIERILKKADKIRSDPKSDEWNLLKDQFAALVHNEGVRQDCLEQILDDGIRRRFGELIAWAAGHDAKGYHGPWPPGPYRDHR